MGWALSYLLSIPMLLLPSSSSSLIPSYFTAGTGSVLSSLLSSYSWHNTKTYFSSCSYFISLHRTEQQSLFTFPLLLRLFFLGLTGFVLSLSLSLMHIHTRAWQCSPKELMPDGPNLLSCMNMFWVKSLWPKPKESF